MRKKVIINADDFGYKKEINHAIYCSWQSGLITDTTLMATGPEYDHAKEIILADADFSKNIGVHLNLTSGIPLTEPIQRCKRLVKNGTFTKFLLKKKWELFPLSASEKKAIEVEITEQLDKVIHSGIKITHVDSHQHVHTNIRILPIIIKVCKKKGIHKIRIYKNIVDRGFIRNTWYGLFNRRLRREGMVTADYFGNLSEYHEQSVTGVLEMMVHPDIDRNGNIVNRVISKDNNVHGNILESEVQRAGLLKNFEVISYKALK